MLYVLQGVDIEASGDKRLAHVTEHRARLAQLQEQGRLVLAGPMPAIDSPDPGPAGMFGSLIIAEFPSLSEAQTWWEADAYVREGVFASTSVRPFRRVLPK